MRLLLGISIAIPAFAGSLLLLLVTVNGYRRLARRRRGEVYPATPGQTGPRRQLQPIAWVRAPGQLRWHQARFFTPEEGEGTPGLVVDQLSSLHRRYVFDDTCVVEPTDAVMTFALSSSASTSTPRVYHALRVADARQSIDVAVDTTELPRILAAGDQRITDHTEAGPTSPVVAQDGRFGGRRDKLVGLTDRATVSRRAMAALIERQSRARRSVSAACSVASVAGIGLVTWISDVAATHHMPIGHSITDLDLPLGLSALFYAFRAVRRRPRSSAQEARAGVTKRRAG